MILPNEKTMMNAFINEVDRIPIPSSGTLSPIPYTDVGKKRGFIRGNGWSLNNGIVTFNRAMTIAVNAAVVFSGCGTADKKTVNLYTSSKGIVRYYATYIEKNWVAAALPTTIVTVNKGDTLYLDLDRR